MTLRIVLSLSGWMCINPSQKLGWDFLDLMDLLIFAEMDVQGSMR